MKVYDTHSDIFSNLYERKISGEKNVFEKYHLSPMTKGNIKGGIWVVYSECDFDVYEAYKIALKEFEPFKDNYDVVYGLEGLRNVHTLDDLNKMYELGVRHAMLTWNEENHLATGVAGDANRGLTKTGKEFLDYMKSHHMMIDVSHLNIKSFYDVVDYVGDTVIASHSNAYSLSDHRRNLNDEQLKMLKSVGGYVGAVSARNFVSKDPSLQNVKGLANQIIYLGDKLGIDHIMLGLDIMDFLKGYEGDNANLDDLRGHGDTLNLIEELKRRNLTNEEIEKIAYKNFMNYRKGMKINEKKD